VDPALLEEELRTAAEVLRPNLFKLTGGEPLLHPRLLECVEVARRSGIASQISLTTNGFLLKKAPDGLFRLLDRLTVSWYSSAPLSVETMSWIETKCVRHNVLLNLKPVTAFQRMTPENVPQTAGEAERVFAGCWMKERCHLLYRGRFFTCTRPPHLGAVHGIPLDETDGVRLSEQGLLDRLIDYLEGEEPLQSCRYCLGTSGPYEEHGQLEPLPKKLDQGEPRSVSVPSPAGRGRAREGAPRSSCHASEECPHPPLPRPTGEG
jgi:hypothetical protein